jgi:hypothetical protein
MKNRGRKGKNVSFREGEEDRQTYRPMYRHTGLTYNTTIKQWFFFVQGSRKYQIR